MSFIIHFIAFLSMTFVVVTSDMQYSYASLDCLDQIDIETRPHWERIKLLQEIMEIDYLWWPILVERVRVKQITYHNQYEEFKEENVEPVEVLALENISNLFASKAFPAKDVKFTMEVVKTAMVCSALKHISFQGLVFYKLLKDVTIERMEKLLFVMWMVDMVYVVIDKLTTMNDAEPLLLLNSMRVGLIHLHRSILKEETEKLDIEFLHKVGKKMFDEVEKVCVKAAQGDGYYKALVTNLNRIKWVDDLKAHHVLITEYLNDSTDIVDIDRIHEFKGPINIKDDIDVFGITQLNEPELKRAYGANFVQTNFLFGNLPVHTLIESQWKPIIESEERYKAPPKTDDSPEDSPEVSPEDSQSS